MPWSETDRMDQRAQFVIAALEGWTSMSELCEQYGISRRIGYKWVERFKWGGLAALEDRSTARKAQAAATPKAIVDEIVALRGDHPTWGPRKLRARLAVLKPEVKWPAGSTIGELLKREGLVKARRRRQRPGVWTSPRTEADEPNQVWTADFKGEFRLGCGRLCYPLTVTDACTRYLLGIQSLASTAAGGVHVTFERIFREYGLPEVIRTDNGIPFSSAQAVGGLSQLAVWWIRLGIRLERTRRRHPEDNGAHERMHRTLKAEATKPARMTPQLQQKAFDRFRREYNQERPHEALGQKPPASLYRLSPRNLPHRLPELVYPESFQRRRINRNGEFAWRGKLCFVSRTLMRQTVGLEYSEEGFWNIYFGPALLAQLHEGGRAGSPGEVLPMCPV